MTDAPGRVLPTIRSRCRTLILRPLAAEDVARAAAAALGEDENHRRNPRRGRGGGRLGRTRADGSSKAMRSNCASRWSRLLERLPELDPRALHALGDEIAGTEAETLAAFMDAVNAWLGERLKTGPQEPRRLARIAEVWSSVNKAGREAEAYNLDRKPLVFSVFGQLAEAARA